MRYFPSAAAKLGVYFFGLITKPSGFARCRYAGARQGALFLGLWTGAPSARGEVFSRVCCGAVRASLGVLGVPPPAVGAGGIGFRAWGRGSAAPRRGGRLGVSGQI